MLFLVQQRKRARTHIETWNSLVSASCSFSPGLGKWPLCLCLFQWEYNNDNCGLNCSLRTEKADSSFLKLCSVRAPVVIYTPHKQAQKDKEIRSHSHSKALIYKKIPPITCTMPIWSFVLFTAEGKAQSLVHTHKQASVLMVTQRILICELPLAFFDVKLCELQKNEEEKRKCKRKKRQCVN